MRPVHERLRLLPHSPANLNPSFFPSNGVGLFAWAPGGKKRFLRGPATDMPDMKDVLVAFGQLDTERDCYAGPYGNFSPKFEGNGLGTAKFSIHLKEPVEGTLIPDWKVLRANLASLQEKVRVSPAADHFVKEDGRIKFSAHLFASKPKKQPVDPRLEDYPETKFAELVEKLRSTHKRSPFLVVNEAGQEIEPDERISIFEMEPLLEVHFKLTAWIDDKRVSDTVNGTLVKVIVLDEFDYSSVITPPVASTAMPGAGATADGPTAVATAPESVAAVPTEGDSTASTKAGGGSKTMKRGVEQVQGTPAANPSAVKKPREQLDPQIASRPRPRYS